MTTKKAKTCKRYGCKVKFTPTRSDQVFCSSVCKGAENERRKKTARKKADSLLTPWIIGKNPYCLLCGHPSQVAHHHVHKSQSSRLRYEEINLIPLCGSCHNALHHNESYWSSKIVEIKGVEWFKELDKMKSEYVSTDRHFYEGHYERIKADMV